MRTYYIPEHLEIIRPIIEFISYNWIEGNSLFENPESKNSKLTVEDIISNTINHFPIESLKTITNMENNYTLAFLSLNGARMYEKVPLGHVLMYCKNCTFHSKSGWTWVLNTPCTEKVSKLILNLLLKGKSDSEFSKSMIGLYTPELVSFVSLMEELGISIGE